MNNKEFKEYWSSKTLGEIKGYYLDRLRVSDWHKERIREKALELANLDFDNKYYVDKAKSLMNDISFYKTDIKNDENDLKILKPILDKKELDGINQEEYEKYITTNVNLKVLIKAVNDEKQKFIDAGSKVTLYDRNNKQFDIILSEKEVNEIYDNMLKETIMIIKDNIGDIKEVEYMKPNGNKGMDGRFKGKKGTVEINTIMAGGYNVQRLHFRTLVYKYNY